MNYSPKNNQPLFLVYYLLILAIPFSTELNFSGNLSTDFPDEQLMWLVSLIAVFYFLYNPKILGGSHFLLFILSVLLCWTIFTVFVSVDRMVSLKYLLAKFWYIGAFVLGSLIVFRLDKGIHKAAVLLVLSMLAVTLIVLFKHTKTGFSFATVNEAVVPFFKNHVNYSALLVCTIPVCCSIVFITRNKNLRLIAILAGLVFLLALFFPMQGEPGWPCWLDCWLVY